MKVRIPMIVFTVAVVLAMWPFHHKAPVLPTPDAPAVAIPTAPDPMLAAIKHIEDHCSLVSFDDTTAKPIITVMFLADDDTWAIGSDCFSAFAAWKVMRPARELPRA
jgi:hypothetical protein